MREHTFRVLELPLRGRGGIALTDPYTTGPSGPTLPAVDALLLVRLY